MYGENAATKVTSTELASIDIANIPNRDGQMLRNELVDYLQPAGTPAAPRYKLEVLKLSEELRDLDVTVRSDTTREQMKLSAIMKLTDLETGKVVLRKDLSARGSYNILESEYTSLVSRQDLRKDLIERLAAKHSVMSHSIFINNN